MPLHKKIKTNKLYDSVIVFHAYFNGLSRYSYYFLIVMNRGLVGYKFPNYKIVLNKNWSWKQASANNSTRFRYSKITQKLAFILGQIVGLRWPSGLEHQVF